MRLALREAERAMERSEVPVGAVYVLGDEVIARGSNLREHAQDPTAHAELIALRAAATYVDSWRLDNVTCYVTLEPCPMCAGALVNARVPRVVYGADDAKAGATRSLYAIGTDGKLNHRFELVPGVLAEECGAILTRFFRQIRDGSRTKR